MELKSSEPFENLKFSLSLMGIWTEKISTGFSIRRVLFILFLLIFVLSSILGFYHVSQSGEIEKICSSMAIFLLTAFVSCTLLLMQNKRNFQKWITGMFHNERFLNNHPNTLLRTMYISTIKQIWPQLLFKINKWTVVSATALYAIAMFLYVLGKQKDKERCIVDPECRMVFMGYYYFPWNGEKHYWLANIETVLLGTFLSIISCYRDIYLASFICHLRARLSALSYVIKHQDEFVNIQLEYENHSTRGVYNLLKQCIREHQDIIRNFRYLQNNLSMIFFSMLIIHTPVIVNTAIIAFQGKSLNSFSIFIYCAALYGCSHLFLVLWLSEQLSSESSKLSESIYFCSWYNLEVHQQKILLIMLMKAQKPFVLSCGPLFPSNLSTFMKALKAVYTLLNAFFKLSK